MAKRRDTLLVAGEQIARYGFGEGHPFGPDRHDVFLRELKADELDGRVALAAPRLATREELEIRSAEKLLTSRMSQTQ